MEFVLRAITSSHERIHFLAFAVNHWDWMVLSKHSAFLSCLELATVNNHAVPVLTMKVIVTISLHLIMCIILFSFSLVWCMLLFSG